MARTSRTPASPSARPVGLKEIAAALGLSPGTVSRALNNRYGVDVATRERVVAEARRLGYAPDLAARRLKSHPSLRLGLLFAPFIGPGNAINPAALATVEALKAHAAESHIALTVVNSPSDADLGGLCAANEFDVLVAYGHFEPSALRIIEEAGAPAVLLQRVATAPRQIAVRVDTRAAAYHAVFYLAALGHRRVALVAGPADELHHHGFRTGFAEAVEEFGLHAPENWRLTLSPGQINRAGGAAAIAPLLGGADRPTAIVFASDWLALGGLDAATAAGLSVPHDLSITGFDNLDIGARGRPPLTTFDVHLDRLAATAMQAATELVENPLAPANDAGRDRTVLADFIKRGSCLRLER